MTNSPEPNSPGPNSLVLPDGVRLIERDELPGSGAQREAAWARVASARLAPGFLLRATGDDRFPAHAEANVDASALWAVFDDLARTLLGPAAALVLGGADDEPAHIGTAATSDLLALLEPHRYALAHDGFLHFGLVTERDGGVTEIFVAPTRHLTLWGDDEGAIRRVFARHGVPEAERLERLVDYPHVTLRLPAERTRFASVEALVAHLWEAVGGLASRRPS